MNLRSQSYEYLDTLPIRAKSGILFFADQCIVMIAFTLATMLRMNSVWPTEILARSLALLLLLMICAAIAGYLFGTFAIKLRTYEAHGILRSAIWATTISIVGFLANIIFVLGAPRTVPIIFGLLAFFMAYSLRLIAAKLLEWLNTVDNTRIPVAVYGAGTEGLQLVSALRNSTKYKPVLLVDDDLTLQRLIISGLRVRPPRELHHAVLSGRIKEIILALPSHSTARNREVLGHLRGLECPVFELPGYERILRSGGLLSSLQPIQTDDLLGRMGVNLNLPDLHGTYADKVVLITGAGGSIGSELCRKMTAVGARKLILFEHSELALYHIEREIRGLKTSIENDKIEIVPVLGSISDKALVRQIILECKVEVILHAAAYKHVTLVEANPCQGVRNNVLGTQTLAEFAAELGVQRFIMISTDKAVRPTGTMGASKRLAEQVIQDIQSRSNDCVFGIVRFGNVLGSSGSVIPLFRDQINKRGPVTLTHSDVTRYFMTINEATHLVLLAGTYAQNGEVFVLDMGEPVRIEDLAKRMIAMSGYTVKDDQNPNGDIAIHLTGLRDGEKLYEELLIGENTLPTPHPKIMRATENILRNENIATAIKALERAILDDDVAVVDDILRKHVEGFPGTFQSRGFKNRLPDHQ